MSVTRRRFLQTAAVAAAVPSLARWNLLSAQSVSRSTPDVDPHSLAARAVDAARSAGASYADVRLTHERMQGFHQAFPDGEQEYVAVGVRVLVNGYWGFLSSADWTPEEMVRLATGAVAQAKAHSLGRPRVTDLGAIPIVSNGVWTMPIQYDPFDISNDEKADILAAVQAYARRYNPDINASASAYFRRIIKVFASSEGSSWTQTTYRTNGELGVYYPGDSQLGLRGKQAATDFLPSAGYGWEYIANAPLIDAVPSVVASAEEKRHVVPVDVGRYDLVLSAAAMAALMDQTIGVATELDRAMGLEANASGTSYLARPLEMLGVYRMGSPLLNVTANRSLPGGVATVRWDDEGVEPQDFTIVKDGVLVDFQTTREQAAWLAPYYQRIGRPIRSHGCAHSDSASNVTMQHTPNLALMPGADAVDFDDMVKDTKRGVAVLALGTSMDQQVLNGSAGGEMREIRDGKLGKYIDGATITFRTPELWKNLVAVGGPGTQRWFGGGSSKGQPKQDAMHSVAGVPAKITGVAVIDARRRA